MSRIACGGRISFAHKYSSFVITKEKELIRSRQYPPMAKPPSIFSFYLLSTFEGEAYPAAAGDPAHPVIYLCLQVQFSPDGKSVLNWRYRGAIWRV